jgi:hypothetical protein
MTKNRNSSTSSTEEEWTTEKLIDEIFLHLISITENLSNSNGEMIEVKKHQRKARELIWRIPIEKPTPEFIIEKSDLTDKIRKALVEITSVRRRQDVLK